MSKTRRRRIPEIEARPVGTKEKIRDAAIALGDERRKIEFATALHHLESRNDSGCNPTGRYFLCIRASGGETEPCPAADNREQARRQCNAARSRYATGPDSVPPIRAIIFSGKSCQDVR